MIRALAVGLLAFSLAGCSTLRTISTTADKVEVTPRQVFLLESGYNTVRIAMVEYRKLPPCTRAPAPCKTRSAVEQIQKADASAMEAIHALDLASVGSDAVGLARAYKLASIAIDAATNIAKIYGAT